jgi:signal recognition particle receptor subunit beta
MVVISYSGKEANAKIVYYGPGLGGKTTNLEFIYDSVPASSRGKMVSMKTQTDRTLFFDFLPLDLGELGGFRTRFLLYTVPGQVFYNATRKLVLRGCDAIAFIADSQVGKMDENKESLANLVENLADYDLKLDDIPWVIQYNKRDLPEVYTVEELNRELNPQNVPCFEAVSTEGTGVFETFRGLSRLLLEKLSEEIGHRMIMSRPFGRRQEQQRESEIPEVKPTAEAQPVREPEKAEPEAVDLASQVSSDTSEVDMEELEILPRDETGPRYSQDTPDQEIPHAGSPVEPEPTIAHEKEILLGFFGEIIHSTPLEKEIVREEVILSKESDLAAVLEPLSRRETEEQVTEAKGQPDQRSGQQMGEPVDNRVSAGEPASEQVSEQTDERVRAGEPAREQVSEQMTASERANEEVTESDRPEKHVIASDNDTEASGEEPFFRQMVRRNNLGIFGEHKQEAVEHAKSFDSHEQVGPEGIDGEQIGLELVGLEQATADVKSLEQVIEIPASMLQGDKEKEIVITLRLRLKADAETREAPADEFLLDGISR